MVYDGICDEYTFGFVTRVRLDLKPWESVARGMIRYRLRSLSLPSLLPTTISLVTDYDLSATTKFGRRGLACTLCYDCSVLIGTPTALSSRLSALSSWARALSSMAERHKPIYIPAR